MCSGDGFSSNDDCLYHGLQASIDVECLIGDTDFSLTLSRTQLEEVIAAPLSRLPAVAQRALTAAMREKRHVSEVVVLGGASRMPAIQEALKVRDFNRLTLFSICVHRPARHDFSLRRTALAEILATHSMQTNR